MRPISAGVCGGSPATTAVGCGPGGRRGIGHHGIGHHGIGPHGGLVTEREGRPATAPSATLSRSI